MKCQISYPQDRWEISFFTLCNIFYTSSDLVHYIYYSTVTIINVVGIHLALFLALSALQVLVSYVKYVQNEEMILSTRLYSQNACWK